MQGALEPKALPAVEAADEVAQPGLGGAVELEPRRRARDELGEQDGELAREPGS
jgi:hypothetical protein